MRIAHCRLIEQDSFTSMECRPQRTKALRIGLEGMNLVVVREKKFCNPAKMCTHIQGDAAIRLQPRYDPVHGLKAVQIALDRKRSVPAVNNFEGTQQSPSQIDTDLTVVRKGIRAAIVLSVTVYATINVGDATVRRLPSKIARS